MRTPEGDALTELVLAVFRLNGNFLKAAERIAVPVGLTAARWQVIGAVIEGPGTVADIARKMGLARQSVQRLADVLVADGTLEYRDNPAHKRAKLIEITERGQSAIARIAPRQHRWADETSEGLSRERLLDALELMRDVSERIEAMDSDEP
ncbi:MarR family winged helix-turn-helix transcriptional regulator [Rhizobium lusitanum]|uniref:DNA-binding MarR family transcriptional regulator n=1 Tax=Rhizobium lusitanum TaxID=293958 RepID=A0A7X0J064_9HYPH|nr:MarR family transcriptional regulator [Rhizobium lusitanum]MBB6489152.1 DNA-binding MarR family transcriptional regulator [Rhizobium lusitanum]